MTLDLGLDLPKYRLYEMVIVRRTLIIVSIVLGSQSRLPVPTSLVTCEVRALDNPVA